MDELVLENITSQFYELFPAFSGVLLGGFAIASILTLISYSVFRGLSFLGGR